MTVDHFKEMIRSCHGDWMEMVPKKIKPPIATRVVRVRLLIERGIKFVAPFVSSLTAVGVWRIYMPGIPWVWLWLIGAGTYLVMAWGLGWIDERWLWRPETAMYSERNPQLMELLETVKRIERRQHRRP